MKLVLLHGAAEAASRQKLISIKQKFDPSNVVVFEKGSDPKDIIAVLQTISMFDTERLVVLENPSDDFLGNFPLNPAPCSLILWFNHEVDTKKYPGFEVLYFPEGKELSVFPFLDKLGMKELGAYLEMDKLKKIGFDSQYLITMIFYLLRNLVIIPKKARDFVKNKMIRMRKNFTEKELVELYKCVLETDFKIKSGLLEPNQAEFLLVNKFTT